MPKKNHIFKKLHETRQLSTILKTWQQAFGVI